MSTVKNLVYHGTKPPTKEDAVMAQSHNRRTIALDKSKIKEHQQQKAKAQKVKNMASVKYNASHIKDHQKEVAERQASLKTVNKIWSKLDSLRSKK